MRRTALTLLRVNQPNGFDCPGCAWPDPGHTAHRRVLRERRQGRRRGGDPAPGRPRLLRRALARRPGRSHRLLAGPAGPAHRADVQAGRRRPTTSRSTGTGAFALDRRAAALRCRPRTPRRSTPRAAPRNEAAFLYQLIVRRFGTNNLPDCSNMCHESSGAALAHSIGIGKGTVLLDDFDAADLIIVVGQNPGTNHPRMLSALEEAKQQRRPHRHHQPARRGRAAHGSTTRRRPKGLTKGTDLTDDFLQVRLGGDQALFAAHGEADARGRGGRRGVRRRALPRSSTSSPRSSTRSTGTTCSPRPG